MTSVMYGAADGGGSLVELRETLFPRELDLQDFLTKHPALLAGDQMNPVNPRRFMLVTAEAGIAIGEGGSDYFSLDHLFVDQDGIPTLVEVKRSTDTRLRREVIGQMLEYAANACAFWDAARLRSVFEGRCEKSGVRAEDEFGKLGLALADDGDAFWDNVGRNLKQERLRLVFLADKFAPETQRIIEFLNRQVQISEVYAVEVRQYTGGGMTTLVPRVLNPSVLQTDRRAATSARGEQWTEERFYADLSERHGESAVEVMRRIHEWAQSRSELAIWFGRGKNDGSLQIAFKRGGNPAISQGGDVVMLTLWTYAQVEIDFEYLARRAPFDSEDLRRDLWRRLTATSTLPISEDRINKRPNVRCTDLEDHANMQALLEACNWAIAELSSVNA